MKNIFLLPIVLVCLTMNAQTKEVTYNAGSQKLNGIAVIPQQRIKNAPGILILPAWKGIDVHAKQVAESLGKLGYFVFIADIYGEGNYPKSDAEAGKIATQYKQDPLAYQKRIALALEQLISLGANKQEIVAIGYCFGGTGVLEAARCNMNLKGVVSFHGGLAKDATRKTDVIKTKVLVCHGADDPYVSNEDIATFQQEMRTAKADWQMIYYANAVHAFTEIAAGNDNSKGAAYNEKADKRSWQHFMDFLKEVLQ